MQLALGDALALALLKVRGFQPEDFARSHPGGALGRRLLTHVRDVMRSGEQVPAVPAEASLAELMREMSAKGLGATAVVDTQQRLIGIFTDGDLRRLIEKETQSGRADGLLALRAENNRLVTNRHRLVAAVDHHLIHRHDTHDAPGSTTDQHPR